MADAADFADTVIARAEAAGVAAVLMAVRGEGLAACAECGEVIPAARRAAYPAARTCLPCQEILERAARTGAAG